VTIEADDEILQDFLVEAGEILEQLGEQLVELEQSPQDADLLNAVFRGFHTVKGGAGFLSLTPMVEVCHRAEDVFNVLRQGEITLDPSMMDLFLRVLDILNDQFAQINNGENPMEAEAELLTALERLAVPDAGETVEEPAAEAPAPEAPAAEQPAQEAANEEGDITDEEFEALLDAMQGGDLPAGGASEPAAESVPASSDSDEITDDEFEALLDNLHGKGKGPAGGGEGQESAPAETPAAAAGGDSENITDEEFEALLDDLHGKGKGPTAEPAETAKPAPAAVPKTAAAKPASAAKPAAAEKPAAPKPAAAKPKTAEATVRVDTKRLDDIMNMVGELVLVRNRLHTLKEAMNNPEVSKAVANLDIVTSDLQASVMKTRMQPIKKVFGRFPRVVRDLARSLKKEVELELIGEETDLDKNLVEALADPLVHLVRNSVDHGVEMPDVRESKGKPRTGKVILAATQEGDHILLTITDDGAGMDAEVLRKKAVEKGIMDKKSAARLEDRECYDLIFAPGFSTKTEISDVSGRGVGMDVVKTRISQLNGSIEIDSELGKGTCFSIKLPLTLAILPTLMVKVGSRSFAIPLSSVNEIFHLEDSKKNIVDGQLTVMVRDRAMPIFYLDKWLATGSIEKPDDAEEQVVVVHLGNQRVGFVVTQVDGQEEVVIKPLGHLLHGLAGFAGATITGDGKIALILDVPSLMKAYAQRI
jgi:two-component system chemotaxis sensor kinase CheA